MERRFFYTCSLMPVTQGSVRNLSRFGTTNNPPVMGCMPGSDDWPPTPRRDTMGPRMRFLHTSDWQLGLRRYYLDQDAQARYAADRFEAIRRLGELARREEAVCIVVAGDVFETNRVDRRTVLRALDAMGEAGVPVLLLPANHDPLDAASVYRSEAFRDGPANVRVLDGEEAVEVAPGFEVVGAPWTTKRPLADLVAERASRLEPRSGVLRVMVGHGAVDTLAPDPEEPAVIRVEDARRCLEAGRYHFLALGDRHSATQVDPRIWYSGSPEATDFDEERPGYVLRVDLEPGACRVEELEVGRWRFRRLAFRLAGEEDLEHLRGELEGLPDKPRTVLRLVLEGQLPLHARVDLDRLLDDLLAPAVVHPIRVPGVLQATRETCHQPTILIDLT